MRFGRWSIAAIGAAPLIVSGAALLSASTLLSSGPARTVLVLPLAMLLPGWALLRAVTGSEDRRDLGLAIGLSAMLSIALFVLIALAMSAGSVPLRVHNFVVGVDVVLVVLAAIIHARERVTRSRAEQPPPLTSAGRSRFRVPTRWIAVALATAVLAGTFAALLATYSSVRPVEANDNPWIGLALVGPAAHNDAVLRSAPGQSVQLGVEVTNGTRTVQKVTILVQVDGGAWRSESPQVLGLGTSTVERVGLSAPRRAGLHHVVLAINGSSGVPGASVGTWVRVVPEGGEHAKA
jgi:Protein of unknown function (DUF1616)